MRRRAFVRLVSVSAAATGLGLAAACAPPPSAATQQPKRVYKVAFLFTDLSQAGPQTSIATFKSAMAELGYIEGQQITYDARDAARDSTRFTALAAEVVALKPDAIVCQNVQAAQELIRATPTIPIVIVSTAANVVEAGLVKELAHPGGNLTGLTAIGPSVPSKRLQLLKEVAPAIRRIAVIQDAGEPGRDLEELQKTAATLGMEVVPVYLRSSNEIPTVLAQAAAAGADSLAMGSTTNFLGGTTITIPIAQFAIGRRWPSCGPGVPQGLLLQYDVQIVDGFGRAARGYVHKIFQGVLPGDLPFEAATTTRLALNVCTASKIGLTVPQSVLAQVTEVFQCP